MKVTVIGMLEKVVGIGGESTGWAVALDAEQEIGGQKLKQIEVDPAGKPIEKYEGKRVEIKGELTTRHGIERPDYKVIKVESIEEVR